MAYCCDGVQVAAWGAHLERTSQARAATTKTEYAQVHVIQVNSPVR